MLACQRQIPEAVRNGRQATGRVRAIHFGLALHMTAASPMSEEGQKRQGQLRSDAGLCPENPQERKEFVELGDRWIDPRAKPPCGPSKFSVSGQRVGWISSALAMAGIWGRWRSIEG